MSIQRYRTGVRRGLTFTVVVATLIALVPPSGRSALLSTAAAGEVVESGSNGFELGRGVIVAPTRGVAYLMKPGGGIDAIDLVSGKARWSTAIADRPLVLDGENLVAQADGSVTPHLLPIVVMTTEPPIRPTLTVRLPLPEGVLASIDDGLGTSFTTTASIEQRELILRWHFSKRMISGIARPDPVPLTVIEGAAQIALATGQVESEKSVLGPQAPAPLPESIAHLADSREFSLPPRRVGNFIIAAEQPNQKGRVKVLRWDSGRGEKLGEIELAPDFSVGTPSADSTLLLTRKRLGADTFGLQYFLWAIYSLATGERVAQVRMPVSSAPFAVWHSILIYETRPYAHSIDGNLVKEPLALRGVDIGSGAEVWKSALRDTTYRGPFPPHP